MTSMEKQKNCMPLATAGLPTLPCFTASEKVGFPGSGDVCGMIVMQGNEVGLMCWLLKCC